MRVLFFLLLAVTIVSAAPFEVGVAEVDLEPPLGMRLCGTFREKLATGRHDPLAVRAFVFSQGEVKVALAGCDVAMMSPRVADAVRENVAALGLLPEHVIIHASETHNAPDHYGEFREAFHRDAIEKYGSDPAEPIDFSERLIERITEAIERADADLAEASVSVAETTVEGIAFNRRFHMKDGSLGWNPGKGNPDIVGPAGPVDESLPVLALHRPSREEPFAMLASFSLHLAILNDLDYSADYPFYISERLRETVSPDLFFHFLQAPCCEINHIDVSSEAPQKGHPWAKHVGEAIADRAAAALAEARVITEPDLAVRSEILEVALQSFTAEDIADARETWFSPSRTELPFLELVRAAKVAGIDEIFGGGPIPVRLQAFQLDAQTTIVALPSEVSVEIGLMIKAQSPYVTTIILQNSNDWFGYVPTRSIFEQGHYEAEVAKIQPGEGERIAENVIEMLHAQRAR